MLRTGFRESNQPCRLSLFFLAIQCNMEFFFPSPSSVSTSSGHPQALVAQPTCRCTPVLRQYQWKFLIRGTKQICMKISLCHIFLASKIIIDHLHLFLHSKKLLWHCILITCLSEHFDFFGWRSPTKFMDEYQSANRRFRFFSDYFCSLVPLLFFQVASF